LAFDLSAQALGLRAVGDQLKDLSGGRSTITDGALILEQELASDAFAVTGSQ
jgi:hypothetical protein